MGLNIGILNLHAHVTIQRESVVSLPHPKMALHWKKGRKFG